MLWCHHCELPVVHPTVRDGFIFCSEVCREKDEKTEKRFKIPDEDFQWPQT